MIDMEILNDAELLQNVKRRFAKDQIFTYVGPTLIILNPFKKVVDDSVAEKYIRKIVPAKGNALIYKEFDPHIFAIASEAYRCMFDNRKD